jgi:hypothetical protein
MLDFLLELERVLKLWPDNTKWSLVDIAEKTDTKVPHVVDYICEVMNKNVDVHEPLTYNEVNKAHMILMDRKRPELEALRQQEKQAIQQSIEAYHQTKEKIRIMEMTKNWRAAYKTLNYFYGIHQQRLPLELRVDICSECIRLGMKESINIQELSQWLKRGVQELMNKPSPDSIEDALDFLDAYGDYFLTEPNGRGEKFLTNMFLLLKPSAMEFDLSVKLNEIAKDLELTTVMDVYI